jgi:predicted TIM-barrel fold metal-dependent hydrolase
VNVFDAHTHFFGREFYEYQATLVNGADPEATLDRIRAGGIEIPERDAAEHGTRWIREMDRHRIDRVALFASVPEEMIVVGEVAAVSGGRFVPFATVNPTVPVTLSALRGLLPRFNFRGMLLFPAMHDYSIQSPDVTAALELAKAHGMVAFVHCGRLKIGVRELIGLDPEFPAERSRPRDVAAVARAHPDVAFILPHFGSGFFDEALDLAAAYRNVYMDTAGSQGWAAECTPPLSLMDIFRQTRDAIGAERILYGSDSGVFPRGYRADLLLTQIEAMMDAGFSAGEREAVLGGNLSRLLGM